MWQLSFSSPILFLVFTNKYYSMDKMCLCLNKNLLDVIYMILYSKNYKLLLWSQRFAVYFIVPKLIKMLYYHLVHNLFLPGSCVQIHAISFAQHENITITSWTCILAQQISLLWVFTLKTFWLWNMNDISLISFETIKETA